MAGIPVEVHRTATILVMFRRDAPTFMLPELTATDAAPRCGWFIPKIRAARIETKKRNFLTCRKLRFKKSG
jgi:hypothetical protein